MIGFIISIAIGIAAGFIASKIFKMNLGVLFCLVVGIAGSILGNIVFSLLGISANNYLGGLIMSTIGAIMVLWLVHYFKKKG